MRILILPMLAAAGALLAACGGGGGGGSGPELPTPPATTPTEPTKPVVVTNPSLPLNPPSVGSEEYQRNYGLATIQANVPYGLGATGKGVTVAVIDTGYATNAPDMQGAYSPDSKDLYATRNQPGGVDGHGAQVASVLGARFNNLGALGAAYESTVLGIRADSTEGDHCINSCVFTMRDLATAIDYATLKGAKVVNMSLADVRTDAEQSALFEAALSRAVAAGVVFTVAAGNAGEANPAAHARYATDSRYLGAFLAIGAMAPDGGMATFSNRAGVTAAGYIAAPGQNIVNDCSAQNICALSSGTSFASPQVAGGLAMLLQYFPNLSGRDAVAILLRTADDRAATGVDEVWGNGSLNLAKAFAPVGAQTLSLPGGASLDLASESPTAALGAAFGDAVQISGGLTTVIHDDYNRLFTVDLAQGYRRSQRQSAVANTQPPVSETAQSMALPAGAALTLASEQPMFPYADADASPVRMMLRPDAPASARASVQMGSFGFTAWRGQGQVAPPTGPGGRNAFMTLAQADRTVSGVWRSGALAFSGEGGWSERRTALSIIPVEASRYATATAAYVGSHFALSVSAGSLTEPRGALGSELDPSSPLALAARTRFAAVGFDRPLGPLTLRAEASVGRTDGGGRLVDVENAVASSWRVALAGTCDAALPCARFGFELAQPLRVEQGLFRALLPDAPANYDDPITFSERRVSAAPTSRELDLRFNIDRPLGTGALRLEAAAAFNPAHQRSAADLGLSAAWRTLF